MKLRRTLTIAAAGLALAGASLALVPASAAPGDSPVKLVVAATGGLAVSVPQPAVGQTHIDLGTVNAGGLPQQTNSLGTVTVADTRTGLLENNWIASASSTALLLDGDSANAAVVGKFIPAASLGYTVGTVSTVVAPTLPPVTAPTDLVTMAAPLPVVTNVSVGPSTLSWNPKLVVTVLPNTLPGTYMGTVTHSVL